MPPKPPTTLTIFCTLFFILTLFLFFGLWFVGVPHVEPALAGSTLAFALDQAVRLLDRIAPRRP